MDAGATRLDLLAARRVPYMARRNFIIELRHLVVWGIFAGLIEGTISGVIVAKTFAASDLLITVVTATPAFANLVSLERFARTRRHVDCHYFYNLLGPRLGQRADEGLFCTVAEALQRWPVHDPSEPALFRP